MASKTRKKWIKLIVLLAIILALGGAAYFAWQYYLAESQKPIDVSKLTTVTVSRGSISATIGATGTLRSKQTATIYWTTSGRVGKINKKAGDAVKTGDVIAEIDPTTYTSQIITAQQELANAKMALQNLKESTTSTASALQAVVTAQKAYDDAALKRERMNWGRASQDQLDKAEADYILAQRSYENAWDLFNRNADRAPEDVVRANALSALAAARQKRDSALANLNWLRGKPEAQELAQADADVLVAKAKLEDAKRTYEKVKNGPSKEDLDAAQAKIDAAQNTINSVRLVAPFDGTISTMTMQVGDFVDSKIGVRFDNLSTFYADLQVSEIDINQIKLGQKGTVTFDAVPNKTFDIVVTDISQVGTVLQGSVNFTVTIQVVNPDKAIKPGMTASANIIVDQVDNVLLVPNRSVQTVNRQQSVIAVREGQIVTVRVRLGLSADSRSQVVQGELQEGEKILANPTELQTLRSTNIFTTLFGRNVQVRSAQGGQQQPIQMPAGGGPMPGGGGVFPPGR
jgi:HlyD family secretion protein